MTPVDELVSPHPPPWHERTVLRQGWHHLLYLHWPYEPAAVQRLLPAGVTVDTHDGAAWVGLIPFLMHKVRVGPLPPLPGLHTFVEVNVRTYVRDRHGNRAVWFFSLDVPNTVVVGVARTAFALPYCWARADHTRLAGSDGGTRHRYTVERRWPAPAGAGADLAFRVGRELEPAEITPLDHFLSARWALLTTRRGRVLRGEVNHAAWPLRAVEELTVEQDLVEAAGLTRPDGPPRALFSPGVEVALARLRPVPR